MDFLEAVKELRDGAKIAHPGFEKGTYLYGKNDCVIIKYPKVEIDFVYRASVSEILDDNWFIWP